MTKLALIILFALGVSAAQAQNRSSLKGKFIDSLDNRPVEFITVAVVDAQDSSLISYTLTTKNGTFTLRNLPSGKLLKIIASHVNYQIFRKIVTLKSGEEFDMGTVPLGFRNTLAEIVIKGERQPVVIKKDTIEFSVEAFKTRPNAVVEDLLKKLPGLQIDMDGTIWVDGNKVTKITIDGKDFFASDITIASRNINAALIDKVQIVNDRTNDPDRMKSNLKVDKVINLKLKKEIKKSVFGKIYAGGGSSDRYETGGILSVFRDALQASFIGFGNNINNSAFSNSDLRASGFGYGSGGGEGIAGIQQIGSGGSNINYDFKNNLKLNVSYLYGNTINSYDNQISQQEFFRDTAFISSNHSSRIQNINNHSISSTLNWKIDTLSTIYFQPRFNINNSLLTNSSDKNTWNNLGEDVNSANGNNEGDNSGFSYGHYLYYYRKFLNKSSFYITNSFSLNPSNSVSFDNNSIQVFNPESETNLKQVIYQDKADKSGNINIDYRYPVTKKLVSEWNLSSSFNKGMNTVATYNYNPQNDSYDVFIANQSADMRRDQWSYAARSGLNWSFSKNKNLRIVAVLNWQNVNNTYLTAHQSLTRRYFTASPFIMYHDNNFEVVYEMEQRAPQISELQPFVTYDGSLNYYSGNADLKPINSHSFNLRYSKFIPSSQLDYTFSSSSEINKHTIITSRHTDENGIVFSKPVNADNNYTSRNFIRVGKRFKKMGDWQLRVTATAQLNFYKNVFLQNNLKDNQYQWYPAFKTGFSVNWKDIVMLEPNYEVYQNINRYSLSQDKNAIFYRHSLNSLLSVRWPKKVVWEFNHQFGYNTQITEGFNRSKSLLNASLSLLMLKQNRGQLKIKGFDVLNQNRNIDPRIYGNTIGIYKQLVLSRYFLLSYTYTFNKTAVK